MTGKWVVRFSKTCNRTLSPYPLRPQYAMPKSNTFMKENDSVAVCQLTNKFYCFLDLPSIKSGFGFSCKELNRLELFSNSFCLFIFDELCLVAQWRISSQLYVISMVLSVVI